MFVSARLRMTPKTSWIAGAQRRSPSGKALGVADHSYCGFALETSPDLCLADALALHIDRLLEHKDFLKEITTTGGTVELYVGWFIEHHAGDVFEASLMERMSAMGIDLAIEVYGPDEKIFEPEILEFKRTPT